MNKKIKMKMENYLYKHLKQNIFQKILNKFILYEVGGTKKRTYLENNVKFLRYKKNIILGDNLIIKEGTRLCCTNQNAYITVGDNTSIGYHSYIFSSGSISIGKNCLIAPFCYVVDSNHVFRKNININKQGLEVDSIKIGNDVWMGKGVTVLPGVKIGDGSVIGANSLVNKNSPINSIVAGNPMKIVGKRK